MTRQEVLELAKDAINEEPEFPGEIPDDMYRAIISGDKDMLSEAFRIAVRLTKQGILQRIVDRLG